MSFRQHVLRPPALLGLLLLLTISVTEAAPSGWNAPVTVDTPSFVGWFTSLVGEFSSLAVVDGNPAISYYDAGNGDLKYVRADSPTAVTLQSATIRLAMPPAAWLFLLMLIVSGLFLAVRRLTAGPDPTTE